MIGIILDGLVLLGLMFLFDRHNPNRDFLETGLVAVILTVASVILNWLLMPMVGIFVFIPYFALCVLLLHKLPEIALRRSLFIAGVFVAFKILSPYVFAALLGG